MYEKHMHAVHYNYTLSLTIRTSSTMCAYSMYDLVSVSVFQQSPHPPSTCLNAGHWCARGRVMHYKASCLFSDTFFYS